MRARRVVLGVLLVSALLLGGVTGLPEAPAAEAALPACAAADPAPQVLDVAAEDVVMVIGNRFQDLSVTLRSACGADYTTAPFEACDLPKACLRVAVGARRTAAATSPAARSCRSVMGTDDEGVVGSAAAPASEPDVFVAHLKDWWTLDDDGDGFHGPINNGCAGAWDITAGVTNEWRDPATANPSVVRARAFSLRRQSHLSTHAGPEPVRAGALVTVRGRLVRENWNKSFSDPDFNGAYAYQSVVLQRRTATGTYRDVRTVRTDRDGRMLTKLRAASTKRCYRWAFAGTSTTAGRVSYGDCVPVRP